MRVLTLSAATRAVLTGREFLGRPIREVLSDLIGQQWVDHYYEVYRTGEPITGREWRAHLTMPDGSVREVYANFTISPWTVDGERRGVIGVGFDVTELVRQRQAATDEAAHLQRRYEHSLEVTTALQRELLQDRLDDGADPASALAAADRFARRVPAAHAATVCVAVLDPDTGDLAYCTAGHPPPLVLPAGGEPRYLPGTGGAPLGTGGSFPVGADRLSPGDVLLLYTDGLLERPGRTHPVSAAELAQAAADSAAGRALHDPDATAAERVCSQTVELLVRATGHQDDITLLAVQRVPVPERLTLSLPTDPAALGPTRVALADWLGALGATDGDTFVLQHAVGELMTNAIEHATEASTVEIEVELTATGEIEATVTDHGRRRGSRPAGAGWRWPHSSPTACASSRGRTARWPGSGTR